MKIVMYEFWYNYIKSKYQDKVNLCYIDTDSFIVSIKTKDVYKGIANDVAERFDKSNFEIERPLIGLRKDELGGKIMIDSVGLRPKTYSYSKNHFI